MKDRAKEPWRQLFLGLLAAGFLLLPGRARGEVSLTLDGELAGGYDSNLYLDAYALPTSSLARGGLLHFSPSLQILLGAPGPHRFFVTYSAEFREVFLEGNGHESRLDHGAELAYRSPPFFGFWLSASAGFEQLYFRVLSNGGWLGPRGGLKIGRSLGPILRATLGYALEHATFSSSISPELPRWELSHRILPALALRLYPGLLLEVQYTASFVQADRPELGSIRHQPGVGIAFAPPTVPLEVRGSYGLHLLSTDAVESNPAGKLSTTSRFDLIHEILGEVRVEPRPFVALFARYTGLIGTSDVVEDYSRHVALLGIALTWERLLRPTNPRTEGPPHLDVRLDAPGARQVAVVGTFNEWDPSRGRLERRGAVWEGRVVLPPGRHQYLLWVDGVLRLPPGCEAWASDGFGGRSCTIVAGE